MQMTESLAKLKAEILLYENEIKKQTELKDKNVTAIMNVEKKMTDSVEEWIRYLRQHEEKMKQKFREIYKAEQKQHETRLENLEPISTQLKSCMERGQGVLKRNISAEIVQTNQTILQRCDELINARKSERYKSPCLNYIVKKKFDIFEQILVSKSDSSICLAEFDDNEIGRESNFVVVARDLEVPVEGDHLKAELKDSKDGKYIVMYTPQCVGQYSAEIQVNGQPLTGSPFVVQIRQHPYYQFAFKFGSAGRRAGEFAVISDIAVSDRSGTIAVADMHNKRIQLFSSDGKFQMQLKLDGKPSFVAFTDCGDLLTLVSGNNNKRRLFSEEGKFIKDINDKHLNKPQRLCIASDGVLIITDHTSNEVKVLSPDGNDHLVSMTAPNCDKYPECVV